MIPQEEAIKRCSLKEHELELECSLKLPGAASAETVIQALRLLVKQYLPDSISDWSQERFLILTVFSFYLLIFYAYWVTEKKNKKGTDPPTSISLSSPDGITSVQLKCHGQEKDKSLSVTWPLAVDSEIEDLIANLKKYFLKVAPR